MGLNLPLFQWRPKGGGFLLQPLLHCVIPCGVAMSYTVSTSSIILFSYALRCSLIYACADCICNPLFKLFMLALVSLLCMAGMISMMSTEIFAAYSKRSSFNRVSIPFVKILRLYLGHHTT